MKLEIVLDKPRYPPIKEFIITLTPQEAEVLKSLFGGIGGNIDGPVRSVTSKIWDYFDSKGVKGSWEKYFTSDMLTAR